MSFTELESLILSLPTSAVARAPPKIYQYFTDSIVPGLSVRQLKSIPNQERPFREALALMAEQPPAARKPRAKKAKAPEPEAE